MRFVIKNLSRMLIENWKYSLLILFDLVLCSTVIFILLQNYFYLQARHDMMFFGDEPATMYSAKIEDENVVEALSEGVNRTPFFHNAIDMFEEFNKSNIKFFSYKFIPVDPDSLLLESGSNLEEFAVTEKDQVDGSDYSFIPVTSVSENTIEGLELKISDGRSFMKDDFYNTDSDTPLAAVLGYSYKGKVDLGDKIVFENGHDREELIVVGFLKEGSALYAYGIEQENYDNSIFVPTDGMTFPRNSEVKTADDVDKERYGNLVCGSFVYCEDTDIDVQKEINKITSKYGFFMFSVTPINGSAFSEAKEVSEKNIRLMLVLAVIMTIACVLSLGGILYSRAIKDRATNCIYLCCGIPLYKINLSVIIEMVVLAVISVMPCVAISLREFDAVFIPYWHMGVYIVFVAFVSLVPVFVINGKCNLDLMIRNQIK